MRNTATENEDVVADTPEDSSDSDKAMDNAGSDFEVDIERSEDGDGTETENEVVQSDTPTNHPRRINAFRSSPTPPPRYNGEKASVQYEGSNHTRLSPELNFTIIPPSDDVLDADDVEYTVQDDDPGPDTVMDDGRCRSPVSAERTTLAGENVGRSDALTENFASKTVPASRILSRTRPRVI